MSIYMLSRPRSLDETDLRLVRARAVASVVKTWVAGAFNWIYAVQERARQRRDLLALGDHMLRDIGINRATAADEASKPFWRS